MTRLIIARHGNTFGPNDTPTRVGARTDLPLVASGLEQGRKLGEWLKNNNVTPDVVYCSDLQRTKQTAETALETAAINISPTPLSIFNEIDYDPDENKIESDVIARIGEQAIIDWDQKAIVPDGWGFDPQQCIRDWQNFANDIVNSNHQCVFVITSNGIARFAPHITGNFEDFAQKNKIKLSTGALAVLEFQNGDWNILEWNVRP